jgi:hypothetical protein
MLTGHGLIGQVISMTDKIPAGTAPILPDQADYLIAAAARAPSVHNTQPWRFRVEQSAIELYSDPRRRLRLDPKSREKLISCGAALFGLRLAVRSLGYQPVVELLPDQARPRLLARVTVGAAEPMTAREHEMFKALPHRHTHRGGFAPDPLPAGLLAGLQHDALAERARLDIVDPGLAYQRLAEIVGMAGSRLDRDPRVRGELLHWTRHAGSSTRDGVPAHAFVSAAHQPGRPSGRLRQRDFDLGRGLGRLADDGSAPAVTAVLLTCGDSRADWLHAGQALHRLLLHAASRWVFASLYTQPLENAPMRALIKDRLALPGEPQMLLQLGVAHASHATGRRPPGELIEP